MKAVKYFFFYLLQFTWGFIQNLMGLVYLIKYRKAKKEWFHGALIVYHEENWGGVSLGMFIFLNGTRSEKWIADCKVHEYGHSIQSIILGPLFMFVIGIPSSVWCNGKKYIKLREEQGVSYYAFYPESGANALGAWATGLPKPSYADDVATAKREQIAASQEAEVEGLGVRD